MTTGASLQRRHQAIGDFGYENHLVSSRIPTDSSIHLEKFLQFCDEDRLYTRIVGEIVQRLFPRDEPGGLLWYDLGAANGSKVTSVAWALRDHVRKCVMVERNALWNDILLAAAGMSFPPEMDVELFSGTVENFSKAAAAPDIVTAFHFAYEDDSMLTLTGPVSPVHRAKRLFMTSLESANSSTAVIRSKIATVWPGAVSSAEPDALEKAICNAFRKPERITIHGKTLDLRGQTINVGHWLPEFLVGGSWKSHGVDEKLKLEIAKLVQDHVNSLAGVMPMEDVFFYLETGN